MNTRFVETFITLARLGSFRATAQAMRATPAAISLRIKSLEEELNTTLIDRDADSFRLTAMGEHLREHARNVIHAVRALQLAARDESEVTGRLRLGVVETVVHSWLPRYIRMLNETYPMLTVDLTVDASAALHERLLADQLDLLLQVEAINHEAIVSTPLASYEVRWIARRDLIAEKAAKLAPAILEWPILTFGRGTAPQIAIESIITRLASQHGVPLSSTRLTCLPSVAVMIKLLRDGYGVAAVPSLLVADWLESGELVELPFKPAPPSIVVTMCHHDDAMVATHAAANVVRAACDAYCEEVGREVIKRI